MDHSQLQSLLDQVESSVDQAELAKACEAFCTAIGVRWYLLGTLSGTSLASPEVTIFTNYPEDWMAHYEAENRKKDDPVVSYIFKKNRPIVWSRLIEQEDYSSSDNLELMQNAAQYGLKNGLSVPLHTPGGQVGVFSLAIEDDSAQGLSVLDEALAWAHTFASGLCERFIHLQNIAKGDDKPLTERQISCLFWAAEGKTTWEIAQILDIKERTVEFHLQNSVEKLGASNRQHAVSIAIKKGLVQPNMS